MELVVDRLCKSFGEKQVLQDLSFTARSGVATGLLGRNGSGKTTTIRTILNIFPPDSGSATIDGVPAADLRHRIGYLPEERGLYPKRPIWEQMVYIGELRGMRRRDAKARALELLTLLEAEEYFEKTLDTLSKGNQQKIQLAIALLTDPDVVILDEPFSGLDPVNAQILRRLVESLVDRGKLVLFSSHQMGYVEHFCDDICMIHQGQVVLAGNLREIKGRYPRDQILITPQGTDATTFQRELLQIEAVAAMVQSAEPKNGDGCLLTLRSAADKDPLLAAVLAAGKQIDGFRVVEPSLEAIFVEKTGVEA